MRLIGYLALLPLILPMFASAQPVMPDTPNEGLLSRVPNVGLLFNDGTQRSSSVDLSTWDREKGKVMDEKPASAVPFWGDEASASFRLDGPLGGPFGLPSGNWELGSLQKPLEGRGTGAFVGSAVGNNKKRSSVRSQLALVALCLAVHAAVTWDAQSTNHFFQHYPAGYRPFETDPLMRPFAGKALMYPMANLLFAVPNDLLLVKTRHSKLHVRFLTYAAASIWTGMEIRQSLLNLDNEHARIGR